MERTPGQEWAWYRMQHAASRDPRVQGVEDDGFDSAGGYRCVTVRWNSRHRRSGLATERRMCTEQERSFLQQVGGSYLLQKDLPGYWWAVFPGISLMQVSFSPSAEEASTESLDPIALFFLQAAQMAVGEPRSTKEQETQFDQLSHLALLCTGETPSLTETSNGALLSGGWPEAVVTHSQNPVQLRMKCLLLHVQRHADGFDGHWHPQRALAQELHWYVHNCPLPPLLADRVVLRPLVWQDFEAMHRYCRDPEVVRYMDWGPNTRSETKLHLRQAINGSVQEERPFVEWGIASKESPGELAGTIALTLTKKVHREASLGYTLAREYWGQGWMTEAVNAMVEWGWTALGLHRTWAICATENTTSIRVLEKAGFEREGYLRDHRYLRGRWHDSYLYGLRTPFRDQ